MLCFSQGRFAIRVLIISCFLCYSSQCLYLENTICIEKEKTTIPRDNNPHNMIGYWKFDDAYAVDHSGNKNQWNPVPEVGPAQGNSIS
jgi:hypothetical protein